MRLGPPRAAIGREIRKGSETIKCKVMQRRRRLTVRYYIERREDGGEGLQTRRRGQYKKRATPRIRGILTACLMKSALARPAPTQTLACLAGYIASSLLSLFLGSPLVRIDREFGGRLPATA